MIKRKQKFDRNVNFFGYIHINIIYMCFICRSGGKQILNIVLNFKIILYIIIVIEILPVLIHNLVMNLFYYSIANVWL